MSHLPVIVGFGGINSAGRTSFHHGFRRYIINQLSIPQQTETYLGLATLMGLLTYQKHYYQDKEGAEYLPENVKERFGEIIRKNTLLRRISEDLFDANHVSYHKKIKAIPATKDHILFRLLRKELPNHPPEGWHVVEDSNDQDYVQVAIKQPTEFYLADQRKAKVQSGSQLPTGFDPAILYNSKNHPRGLQMAVFAATDAIYSTGIDWQKIKQTVEPDKIGVYASSAMGQLDSTGTGGMMKAGVTSQRTSSKQLAMGLVQMPSDFINAYVLGNVGHTGAQVGACATLLYNLNAAVKDIQLGKTRVAIVGSSEAPLIPEVYEGYRAMSALGEDSQLIKLATGDANHPPDYTRACRPFSKNCGFALGESAQYFVLFDDELTIELGAQIFGSIGDVFINADGFKKSISSPGFGNNITLAKALGFARSVIGESALQKQTFISAHGTGTPQNRTTESFGLNEVAKAFGICHWPVSAIKCFVGHSLGPASGDQLAAVLGTWEHGLIPGIKTLDSVADDVHQSNLRFSQQHIEIDKEEQAAAFINAKGFGGNNSTGVILSPKTTRKMLQKKHGTTRIKNHQKVQETVISQANAYNDKAIQGEFKPIYHFGENVLEDKDLCVDKNTLQVAGFAKPVNLNIVSPYADMSITDKCS